MASKERVFWTMAELNKMAGWLAQHPELNTSTAAQRVTAAQAACIVPSRRRPSVNNNVMASNALARMQTAAAKCALVENNPLATTSAAASVKVANSLRETVALPIVMMPQGSTINVTLERGKYLLEVF